MHLSCNVIVTQEIVEQLREEPFFTKDGTVIAYQVQDYEKSLREIYLHSEIALWNFSSDPTNCDATGWSLEQMHSYIFFTIMFHWRNIKKMHFKFWKALPVYHDIIENLRNKMEDNLAISRFLYVVNILTLMGTRIGLYKPTEISSQEGNTELIEQTIIKLRGLTKTIISNSDSYSKAVKALAHNLELELGNIRYFQLQKDCHGDEVSILELSRKYGDVLDDRQDPFFTDVYTECRFSSEKYCIKAQKFTYIPYKGTYMYCLLYTSPSPRDKRQSRMPSSA